MSYTPYLCAIAEALIKQVRPHVTDARARDALEACVRAIAGMGATLDVVTARDVTALALPTSIDLASERLTVLEPPENLAANNQTIARIATGVRWLFSTSWVGHEEETQIVKSMLNWEHALNEQRFAWMFSQEEQSTITGNDVASLQIDRGALEQYFQKVRTPDARISEFRQAVGGRSRQTAVFTLEGTELPTHLVVQRDHPASITQEGVAQQFSVLELLAKSALKVSRPLLLETDREIIGAPFIVMEAAVGTIAGMDYFRPPALRDLTMDLAGQLAILHSIDPSPMLGKLPTTYNTDDPLGWALELDMLKDTWENFSHAPSLAISAALVWMRAHVSQIGDDLAIIHNDAAFHNILAVKGRFSSLLDFELVHLGHPAEDLGYCRQFVEELSFWEDFVEAYVAGGGKRFSPQVMDYFSLRSGIHLLTLLQRGRSVFTSGATTDINLAEVATSFIPKQHCRITRMVASILR